MWVYNFLFTLCTISLINLLFKIGNIIINQSFLWYNLLLSVYRTLLYTPGKDESFIFKFIRLPDVPNGHKLVPEICNADNYPIPFGVIDAWIANNNYIQTLEHFEIVNMDIPQMITSIKENCPKIFTGHEECKHYSPKEKLDSYCDYSIMTIPAKVKNVVTDLLLALKTAWIWSWRIIES
mgnify:CR=1 FL=1